MVKSVEQNHYLLQPKGGYSGGDPPLPFRTEKLNPQTPMVLQLIVEE